MEDKKKRIDIKRVADMASKATTEAAKNVGKAAITAAEKNKRRCH